MCCCLVIAWPHGWLVCSIIHPALPLALAARHETRSRLACGPHDADSGTATCVGIGGSPPSTVAGPKRSAPQRDVQSQLLRATDASIRTRYSGPQTPNLGSER
ncbi:hypothetical protein PF008_g33324 [Phytophthora fragariae]|uniref:Secreted protein n=1 Tax=Phytophthora fragariae TaxID=53985 RepID=A0A6G0PXB5_9STRA|nr:hypothetical protein PF008_g33324 [Phytophthora fragariae]